MRPHEQRVVDEKRELDIKITALGDFVMLSPTYKDLPEEDKLLLREQEDQMRLYSLVLQKRIERFSSHESC